MPINSKRKGNEGEREVLKILKDKGLTAQRNEQRYIGGFGNPDISLLTDRGFYHLEVKRKERFSIYEAMNQAIADSRNSTAKPCVIYRANGKPWLAIMLLEDYIQAVGD